MIEYQIETPHGKFEYYYMSGGLWEEGYIKHGKKEGEWRVYYENGMLMTIENWKDNVMNDSAFGYFGSGQLQMVGFYINGKMDGRWEFYDSISGNLDGYLIYQNDSIIDSHFSK
jgi:antitoxin component YwqK of YwqJK toxin-antitoxin module